MGVLGTLTTSDLVSTGVGIDEASEACDGVVIRAAVSSVVVRSCGSFIGVVLLGFWFRK
jgi:hypothetical protein